MSASASLRQVGALSLLLVRYWIRSGIAGSRIERFRKGSAFLVRLVAVILYAAFGNSLAQASLRNAASGAASVEPMIFGILGFAACWGMLTRALSLRGMALPLASPLIDTLPVRDGARTFVELFEVAMAHVVAISAFVNAAPALPPFVSGALGLGTSMAGATVGAALMRWAFVFVPPERTISLAQVTVILQGLFVVFAMIGHEWTLELSFLAPIARPLAGEGRLEVAFATIGAVLVVAVAVLRAAEHVGYDRIEVVPRKRFGSAGAGELSVGRIDELLARREPGGRRWPLVLFGAIALGGFATLLILTEGYIPDRLAGRFAQLFVGLTAWTALPLAAGIAARAVTRDMVARPLLAALPLEPRQLLDGKIAVVRRRLLIGLFPLAFILLAPVSRDFLIDVAWRSAAVLAGSWIYGSAAVSVAFLTGGAQATRPQPGGSFRLEALLLFAPLGALLFAQHAWMTIVPLASLALVAFEAKRAATRVVRWLDDGEDFERETPAWRAALAFAAFQGAQVLAARAVASWVQDSGVVMGASYLISGVVLVGLTVYGRRDLAPLTIWPRNPLFVALAVAAGAGTATFGRFVVRHLVTPHADVPDLHFSAAGQMAFVVSAGVLAPVVEEVFFRGWLQHVISRDLAAPRKWLAPAIAALAFASVHPPASFPAVFALGLVAGVLYAKTSSLAPCVAAHAAHNWVATLVQ
jgi:membrane protease YdiL (CAAX protease family)